MGHTAANTWRGQCRVEASHCQSLPVLVPRLGFASFHPLSSSKRHNLFASHAELHNTGAVDIHSPGFVRQWSHLNALKDTLLLLFASAAVRCLNAAHGRPGR